MHPRVLRLRRRVRRRLRARPLLGRRRRVQLLPGHLEDLADRFDGVVRRLLYCRTRRRLPSPSVDAAELAQQVLHAHVHDLVRDNALEVELRDQAHGAQGALLDQPRRARVAGVVVVVIRSNRGAAARPPQLCARRRRALELLLAGVEQHALEAHGLGVRARVRVRRELGHARREVVAEVGVRRHKRRLRDGGLEDERDGAAEHVGGDGRVVDELGGEAVELFGRELVEDALDGLEGDGGGSGGGRGGGGRSRGGGGVGRCAGGIAVGRGGPGGAPDVGRPDDRRGVSSRVAAAAAALGLSLRLLRLASGRGLACAAPGGGGSAPPVALLGRGRCRGNGDAGLGRGSGDGAAGGSRCSLPGVGVVAVDEELGDGLEGRGGGGHARLVFFLSGDERKKKRLSFLFPLRGRKRERRRRLLPARTDKEDDCRFVRSLSLCVFIAQLERRLSRTVG